MTITPKPRSAKHLQQPAHKQMQGFTLVEILLYIGIIGMAIVTASSLLDTMLQLRSKNQAITEVEQQGHQGLMHITQALRNAVDINTPLLGNESNELSLVTADPTTNPTRIFVTDGILTIDEAGTETPLTNNHVTVSDFSIANNSYSGTPGLITITLTVSYNASEPATDFNYSQHLTTSVALRQ